MKRLFVLLSASLLMLVGLAVPADAASGQITASLTILPPGPGSFSCPPGQSLEVAQVIYTNVSITDNTNGITESISGVFATGCLLPNVRGAC